MTNQELDRWMAEKVMGWNPPHKYLLNDWHPTESISDAFQVVEKMIENGYDFGIDTDEGKWIASFWPKTEQTLSAADTAPLAICLAAKKAMET